jgi:hypothetical protein
LNLLHFVSSLPSICRLVWPRKVRRSPFPS